MHVTISFLWFKSWSRETSAPGVNASGISDRLTPEETSPRSSCPAYACGFAWQKSDKNSGSFHNHTRINAISYLEWNTRWAPACPSGGSAANATGMHDQKDVNYSPVQPSPTCLRLPGKTVYNSGKENINSSFSLRNWTPLIKFQIYKPINFHFTRVNVNKNCVSQR